MSCDPFPWYKRDARAFYEGTRSLSLEARAVYSDLIDLMFIHNGPLADDAKWMGHALWISPRKWRALRDELLASGKIKIVDGCVTNDRAEIELKKRSERTRINTENASKNRETSVKHSRKFAESSEKPNEINKTTEQMALHARDLDIEEEERKKEIAAASSTNGRASEPILPSFADGDFNQKQLSELIDVLHEVGGNVLNRTHGALESASVPLAWIEAGADLNRHVIPAIRRVCKNRSANSIGSWVYFSNAVTDEVAKSKHAAQPIAEALEARKAKSKPSKLLSMYEIGSANGHA